MSTELLATPEEVWAFLSEPRHLADWWPNLASVEPDRRGLAPGARWQVRSRASTWFGRADVEDTLLVDEAAPARELAFELVRARVRAELVLAEADRSRTHARLTVSGSLVRGFSPSLQRDAVERLHDLVQTADTL